MGPGCYFIYITQLILAVFDVLLWWGDVSDSVRSGEAHRNVGHCRNNIIFLGDGFVRWVDFCAGFS